MNNLVHLGGCKECEGEQRGGIFGGGWGEEISFVKMK